ncbi:hypothetical protein FRB90_000965 [Tulasnella sp. 427]|nr:hypothetical protein FRB90_000965 [Tulasnella sp. 427]
MSCNPNRGLAGIGGPAGLAFELFRTISIWRWSKSRDDVVQFFLMVELFERYASINTLEAQNKYQGFKAQVNGYRESLLSMKTTASEEDALRIAEFARGQMESVLKNVGLSLRADPRICQHWQRAAEAKIRYRQIPAPATPTTPTGAEPPICLDIKISLASQNLQPRETRKLDLKKDGKKLLKVLKARKLRHSARTLDVKDEGKDDKDGARQYDELANDPTALPLAFAASAVKSAGTA